MIELKGKKTNVKIFTDNVEPEAIEQIQNMINHEITEGTKIRIMPDVHAGNGSTIGTTIQLSEKFEDWKVCPNVVGVDTGCGLSLYKISDKDIDLEKLDEIINKSIPSDFRVHGKAQDKEYTDNVLKSLSFNIKDNNTTNRIHLSLGTLGGGNHFIELGVDENGDYWLAVHSGSRNLGVQVAKHHQDIAIKALEEESKKGNIDIKSTIDLLKATNRHSEIEGAIKHLKEIQNKTKLTLEMKTLAHLTGDLLKDYLQDMTIAQEYAVKSRETMLDIISKEMNFTIIDKFDSTHNFIEHDNFTNGILRKGATSAKDGERLVIPLNMRDGSLICMGKGNEDWNNSAPHGAGRLMSRTKARAELTLKDFKSTMEGVYSSSIGESTLDEAPEAYKPADEILAHIKPTVDVIHLVKPVYNFKAH